MDKKINLETKNIEKIENWIEKIKSTGECIELDLHIFLNWTISQLGDSPSPKKAKLLGQKFTNPAKLIQRIVSDKEINSMSSKEILSKIKKSLRGEND